MNTVEKSKTAFTNIRNIVKEAEIKNKEVINIMVGTGISKSEAKIHQSKWS